MGGGGGGDGGLIVVWVRAAGGDGEREFVRVLEEKGTDDGEEDDTQKRD